MVKHEMLQTSENSGKMRLELNDCDPNQTMAPELGFTVGDPKRAGNEDIFNLKVNVIVQVQGNQSLNQIIYFLCSGLQQGSCGLSFTFKIKTQSRRISVLCMSEDPNQYQHKCNKVTKNTFYSDLNQASYFHLHFAQTYFSFFLNSLFLIFASQKL